MYTVKMIQVTLQVDAMAEYQQEAPKSMGRKQHTDVQALNPKHSDLLSHETANDEKLKPKPRSRINLRRKFKKLLEETHDLAPSYSQGEQPKQKPHNKHTQSPKIASHPDLMYEAMKSYESELVFTFLRHPDTSILKLAETAKDNELIPPRLLTGIKTLDSRVPKSRAYRYILLNIFKQMTPAKMTILLKVLATLPGTGNVMTKVMEQYKILNDDTRTRCDKGLFSEFHISVLTEILAGYSSKWEEFATGFWLSENKIENIRAMKCKPEMALKEVISSWIRCECEHAKPPKLGVLEVTMRSEIVGLGSKANTIARDIKARDFLDNMMAEEFPVVIYPDSTAKRRNSITRGMACEHITVREGNSVLLETRIKSSTLIWSKNGSQINKLGQGDSIVLVPALDLSVEGHYKTHDDIQNISENVCNLHLETPLDKHQRLLLGRYMTQHEIPEDTWPPSSTGTFISLALIKQGSIHRAGEYSRCTIRGDMDDIYQNKEGITYHRAVSDLSSGDRLLIEGRPGSGKTTLVQKITKDWARGEISMLHVRLLLLIHLRGFFCDPNIGLQDIIRCYFKSLSDIEEIMHYAAVHHGLGFCFVLDGLDEYLPQKGTFIYNLIKKNDLPKSVIIVASRPAAAAKFRHNATRQVEVLGFLKPQISDYIRNYHFSLNSKSQELCKYLDTHPNIYHMCYLPIHACMICFLYDHTSSDLPETETDIYTICNASCTLSL
jgi:hypothetical protein